MTFLLRGTFSTATLCFHRHSRIVRSISRSREVDPSPEGGFGPQGESRGSRSNNHVQGDIVSCGEEPASYREQGRESNGGLIGCFLGVPCRVVHVRGTGPPFPVPSSLFSALFALKIEFVLSSFFAPKTAKCCVSNKSLGSFPLFSIFFDFRCNLPQSRPRFRAPCDRNGGAFSICQLP
jgi:hypothetical protein